MSLPRRRLIRPPSPPPHLQRPRQVQKLHERLTHERAALARWQTKLTRAFNTVTKSQRLIARLERQLANLEE